MPADRSPDYRAVFESLPFPATLVGLDGTIEDLNRASIELAHRTGRRITKEDRVGRPFAAFGFSEEDAARLTATVKQVLREGTATIPQWELRDVAGAPFWTDFHAAAVRDPSGRPTDLVFLRHDITDRVRQERLRDSQERLHEALWRASGVESVEGLLRILRTELVALCPQTAHCSVQLRNTEGGWNSHHLSADGARIGVSYPRTDGAVMTCWRGQRPVYRPDLSVADPYGEAAAIWDTQWGYDPMVRSVLDLPFEQGTVAVNSCRSDAYSADEIRALGDLIRVLSVGFARIEDQQHLALRNRQLEQEVADRKKAEEALAESERRYRRLMETPSGFFVFHLAVDGRYLYVGPQVNQFIGLSPEAFYTDQTVATRITHPDDVAATYGAFLEVAQGGSPREVEFRYQHVDGSWHWGQESLSPMLDPAGRPEGVQVVLQDITARKQAEVRLQRDLSLQRLRLKTLEMHSERDWHGVVEAFQKEIRRWVTADDSSVNVLHLGRGCFTSYGRAAAPDPNLPELLTPAPEIWDRLVATMHGSGPFYRQSRRDPLFSSRLPKEVNSVIDVGFLGGTVAVNSIREEAYGSAEIAIIEEYAGVISEGYRRLEDLRALRESEERFRQAQKMEAIGQLAGGVAHDFNNVLMAMVGFSEVCLTDPALSESSRAALEEVVAAGLRGAELTHRLLAFSRHEAIHPRPLDLSRVVMGLNRMLARLLGEGIELVVDLDPGLPMILFDGGQLDQVVINLAVNARDAMPSGGRLILRTTTRDLAEGEDCWPKTIPPGWYVVLTVEDTGCGMSAEVMEHLFEPFFTTKAIGKGTGLGLAMVGGAVEQNGGFISVTSEPGLGSRFVIHFPAIESAPEAAPPVSREILSPVAASATILVVEDEPAVRNAVCGMLTGAGYTVLGAASGREAVALASRHTGVIDLLLTDVAMPEMGGPEVAASVATLRPGIRILFMSGYSEHLLPPEGPGKARPALLQKPFSGAALLEAVRRKLAGEA